MTHNLQRKKKKSTLESQIMTIPMLFELRIFVYRKGGRTIRFRTAGYDMWSRMEPQNENLIVAMQRLSFKERFVVTEYVLKGKPFKEIAQETGLKEKAVASAYYRSIKKLRAKMGDVK